MRDKDKKLNTPNHRAYLARIKSGKSQAQAAREAGMSQSVLSAFESGDNKESGKSLTLSMVYNVHPEWLLTGKGSIDLPFPFISLLPRKLNYVRFTDIKNYLEGNMENIETITAYLPGVFELGDKLFLTDMIDDSMQCEDSSSIPQGHKLVFDMNKLPEPGNIVLIKIDNKLVVKELACFGDSYIFRSKNKKYPEIKHSLDNANNLFSSILAILVYQYKQY